MKTLWKLGLTALAISLLLFGACEDPTKERENKQNNWTEETGEEIEVDWEALVNGGGYQTIIDPANIIQTMKGFGASDCWDGNWVGQYWNDDKKEQIAEWLFSQEFDESGNPKGIGLSQWRVNLGAGSWEQGLDSEGKPAANSPGKLGNRNFDYNTMIGRWDRRAESFLADITNPAAGYNWEKQKGQQYFFKKAKDMGTEILIAFSNSPLVCWTNSGTANNIVYNSPMNASDGKYTQLSSSVNLKSDCFDDFAGYLADVADHFAGQGYPFDFIAPVNEPQWAWNEDKQEGTSWTNANIAQFTRELDTAIQSRAGTKDKTKIMIAEAAQWDHAYTGTGAATGQLNAFFNSANTATYVGDLPSMNPKIYAGHTYYTHNPDATMVSHRTQLKSRADALGVEIYSSEWCALTDGTGMVRDTATYFDIALYMAKLAHVDIAVAGATSWAFWTAMDTETLKTDGTPDSKDKFTLIGLAPGVSTYDRAAYQTHNIFQSGAIQSMPTLWALGNYSLFVRPGFQRIALMGEGLNVNNGDGGVAAANYTGLMGTAYKSPAGYKDKNGTALDRIVVVWVNCDTKLYKVASNFGDRKARHINCYRTDNSTEDGGPGLRKEGHENGVITIPARSIYTVVYDF
jgi:O-glycosyl hydrolase